MVCTLSFAAAGDILTDVKSPIDVAHLQGLDTHYIDLFFLFSKTESFYETFIWYEHVPPIPMTRASLFSMHTDLCIQTNIHHGPLAGKERHGIVPI